MFQRLSQIDDLCRGDHYYLQPDDECYYLGEYSAGRGYSHSETNQIISNIKKSPLLNGSYQWRYKIQDIKKVASFFINTLNPDWLSTGPTFVPIPPSKAKDDPEYDDRMVQILHGMDGLLVDVKLDIRELLIQTETIRPAHEQDPGNRPKPADLIKILRIDESKAAPTPTCIVLVDDVVTAGSHFKACQHVVTQRFPGIETVGLFVARRINEDRLDDPSKIDPNEMLARLRKLLDE